MFEHIHFFCLFVCFLHLIDKSICLIQNRLIETILGRLFRPSGTVSLIYVCSFLSGSICLQAVVAVVLNLFGFVIPF